MRVRRKGLLMVAASVRVPPLGRRTVLTERTRMTLGWILLALFACAAGVVVGFLIGERKSREQLIAMSARLAAAQENVAEQRQLLERAHEQLAQSFATVSAEALAKNNEAFLQLAKQRFNTLSA